MLRIIGIIGIVVVVLVAGVLAVAATRPDVFRVERSTSIKAPPEKIFPYINEFKRWDAWSPWEKKDPGMKRTYGTTMTGKGATYAWEGNKDVGTGRMEIAESVEPRKVAIKLDFVTPFEAHNDVVFTLEPKGDTTQVRWTMQGKIPYVAKIVHLVFDVDGMVGKDFEAGLASLKAAAEK
jgi:carbon monoxide dehydrogenase subunit G